MRYNLESTLPINAFSPRAGRGPFSIGMTLEGGGGGGGVLGAVTKAVGSVVGAVEHTINGIVQPVYNATLKNIPGVDDALVGLDKSVGKSIPGGWGTVGAVASSFIPGAALASMGMTSTGLATGLGALSGSGVLKKGNNFNLQGAIMGGAMAYGAANLAQGLEAAGGGGEIANPTIEAPTTPNPSGEFLNANGDLVKPTPTPFSSDAAQMAQDLENGANAGTGTADTRSVTNNILNGNFDAAADVAGQKVSNGINSLTSSAKAIVDPTTYEGLGSNLAEAGSGTLKNVEDAGAGIKNLSGLGEDGAAAAARKAFSATGADLTNTVLPVLAGGSGVAAIEEQQKYLDDQLAAGKITAAEYAAAKAKIDTEISGAKDVVSKNPLQTASDLSNIYNAPSLYGKATSLLYAAGGNVQMNPPDDQTGMPNQTPMNNFDQPGIMSMVDHTVPQQTFATGGIAAGRFLSGGGDGMSDSIPANIGGKQEARLADGEFVIPADVVSHIGNGSSKAGAKQLYSMMDRVRKARTGNKMQGKQINPRKYLAA